MNQPIVNRPGLVAGSLFVIAVPIHLLLPQSESIALSAVALSLIGGAYIGFGARAEKFSTFAIELAVAALFGMAALLGLLWHWSALPIGLAARKSSGSVSGVRTSTVTRSYGRPVSSSSQAIRWDRVRAHQ